MGWLSPTGFNDPGTEWADEANAYDNDTGTKASSEIAIEAWSDYLELTHAALSCSKIQYWISSEGSNQITQCEIDVYYSEDWHNLYSGAPLEGEWKELAIGSTQSVTAVRFRFYNISIDDPWHAYVHEADFWEVPESETYDETGREQVILATVGKGEQLTIGETGREQVILATVEKGESVVREESGHEQVILATVEKADLATFNDSPEQVILAAVEETDLATFGEAREQVILAAITGDAGALYEESREQVILATTEKTEQLTMVETHRARPDQRYYIPLTIDHDRVGITCFLTANAASGQKDVAVVKGATFGVGDSIVIKDTYGNRETGTVASVAGDTVTLEDNLANSYTTNYPLLSHNAILKNVTDSTDQDVACYWNERDLSAHFWANVKVDGTDIAVYLPTGEKLKRELVAGSWSRAGETMELHVKVDASTTVDTIVHLYYGYAAAAETNDEDTWDEHYKFVSHMNDDPDTSHIKDSTANHNHGTKKAANEPNEVAGLIGKAQDFDGTDDYINCGTAGEVSADYTYECVATPSLSDHLGIMGKNYRENLIVYSNGLVRWHHSDDLIDSPQGAVTTSTTHIAATRSSATGNANLYIAGISVATPVTFEASTAPTRDLYLGRSVNSYYIGSKYWDSLIDEVRISDIARSAGHIATTNNTLMDSANFYSVGSVVDRDMVILAVVEETDQATFSETQEQVVLAVVEKTDVATFADAHEQVVLVVATETDQSTFSETQEQVVLTVIEEADLATFQEVAHEQVILAIGSETDLATFTDTHEQVVLVVCTGNATAPTAIETGLTQVILVVTEESDFFIHPEYAAGFILEIRDSSDNLLAVLKDAYNVTLEETVNAPKVLSFMIPADNTKLTNLTRANELWVRNMRTGNVISKTRLTRRDDARN